MTLSDEDPPKEPPNAEDDKSATDAPKDCPKKDEEAAAAEDSQETDKKEGEKPPVKEEKKYQHGDIIDPTWRPRTCYVRHEPDATSLDLLEFVKSECVKHNEKRNEKFFELDKIEVNSE